MGLIWQSKSSEFLQVRLAELVRIKNQIKLYEYNVRKIIENIVYNLRGLTNIFLLLGIEPSSLPTPFWLLLPNLPQNVKCFGYYIWISHL